ncbi:MAG: tyrosine-type recombinase/integrase [Sandaracinaceae bacterium]|nr:tyrosine-type recombinase/integrase [Sandaracinaceae bacterium]
MQIEEALERYVEQLEANGRSQHTVQQARRHVMLMATWLAAQKFECDVQQIAHEHVAKFLASNVVRQRADGGPRLATSANAIRSSLRAFFAFVNAASYAPTNAARLVRRASAPPPPPRALAEADATKLVAALARATTVGERRDRVLFTVMLRCGLRLGSAIGLNVEDVDLERATLRLRRTKGGGEFIAFVPEDVVELLRDHIGVRRSGPMFLGSHGARLGGRQARRRLALWAAAAEIDDGAHPHQLRHSFAQRIYDRTGDLLVTGRALGHRSITSTQVYARVSDAVVRNSLSIRSDK